MEESYTITTAQKAAYIESKRPAGMSQYAWAKKFGFKSQQHFRQLLKSNSRFKIDSAFFACLTNWGWSDFERWKNAKV